MIPKRRQDASPSLGSPWRQRSVVRVSDNLSERLVISSKPGSTVLSLEPLPSRRRFTYTDF